MHNSKGKPSLAPARGGRGKKEGLVPPRSLATTRPLGARRPGREGLGADVSIECRSARRYVLTSRGLVNKPPGRTHGLPHVIRALMKVNPVALCVTGTDVPCGWIARRSRRKLPGTRQQQPGLLARALPLQGRCHRFESGWAHHEPRRPGLRNGSNSRPIATTSMAHPPRLAWGFQRALTSGHSGRCALGCAAAAVGSQEHPGPDREDQASRE